jgi:hypothetical protein
MRFFTHILCLDFWICLDSLDVGSDNGLNNSNTVKFLTNQVLARAVVGNLHIVPFPSQDVLAFVRKTLFVLPILYIIPCIY